MSFRHALIAAALVAASASAAAAQQRDDVVLLGEIHGTRPPDAYFAFKARNPDAFTFQRAWKARNPRLRRLAPEPGGGPPRFEVLRRPAGAVGLEGRNLASLGPRENPVEGTVRVPVVLGGFADSGPVPYSQETVQQEFFDGPNSRYGTITELYDEMSGGRVELLGTTTDWVQSELTRSEVAAGASGLGGSRVGEFILDLLSRNRHLDWGQFDNDGPDGVPNSGDDDGFVDVLAVMHPTRGAECNGALDLIWSHKWSLKSATGQVFHTDTPAAGHGRPIAVDDYTIQPVLSCDASSINEIGVLAHELGHGFGLPDLYDTGQRHSGAGRWDLMASGSWGCSPAGGAHRPCHMGAWSKEQLGWVDVIDLEPDVDHGVLTLDPVEDGGTVWRVGVPDSDEYFLLENRQRIGFDQDLHQTGLLVWHVDEDRVLQRWLNNGVNTDGDHMGVHLRQADGRNDLGTPRSSGGNRSDPGDPFPGSTHNAAFHAASVPDAGAWNGQPSGLTLLDVDESAGRISARVLTRFQNVTVHLENAEGDVRVDGAPVSERPVVFRSVPFQEHLVEVASGAPVSEGIRRGFDRWADDADEGPFRVVTVGLEDLELVAMYGDDREIRVRPTLTGQVSNVSAGTLAFSPAAQEEPDGYWFPDGAVVTVEAESEPGYAFESWSGALEGQANPASFEVREPMEFEAAFRLTYEVPDEVALSLEAAREVAWTLTAQNAVEPVSWQRIEGELPPGIFLVSGGRMWGAALETGSYTAVIEARDARGLTASTVVVIEVGPPHLGADVLTGPFLLTDGEPDDLERAFLDRLGNKNGRYDLGDLRAFLLAHPDLPVAAADRDLLRGLVPAVRFEDEGGRR